MLHKILSSFNRGLDGKLNDAATQLDPLDRDGGMLDNLAPQMVLNSVFAASNLTKRPVSSSREMLSGKLRDRQLRSAGSYDPELSGFSDLRCRGCRSRPGNGSPLP